jgi:hypothetical protein
MTASQKRLADAQFDRMQLSQDKREQAMTLLSDEDNPTARDLAAGALVQDIAGGENLQANLSLAGSYMVGELQRMADDPSILRSLIPGAAGQGALDYLSNLLEGQGDLTAFGQMEIDPRNGEIRAPGGGGVIGAMKDLSPNSQRLLRQLITSQQPQQ